MAPYHWSDEQETNIDEAVSPELIEGWQYSRDELERLDAAEAMLWEMDEAEREVDRISSRMLMTV